MYTKLFKKSFTTVLSLLIAIVFVACDSDTSNKSNKDDSDVEFITEDEYYNNNYGDDTITDNKDIKQIDPFKGLSYEISGISPYCKIAINNSGCSDTAQQYVTYTLDKEYYANGETAVIKAELSTYTDDSYKLTSNTSKYKISAQPEYITAGDSIDISVVEKETNDMINASIAEAVGTDEICDLHVYYDNVVDSTKAMQNENHITSYSISSITPRLSTVYISSIKKSKESLFNDYSKPYNFYSFVYELSVTGEVNKKVCYGNIYVNVSASNVVKHPDGSITWDDGKCSVDLIATNKGLENCISNTITLNSNDYNITKIS